MAAPGPEFDYVVIGAGSSGCVAASRLSESGLSTVCLIEAGSSDRKGLNRLLTTMPGGLVHLVSSRKTNWYHEMTGTGEMGDRVIPCPRGRIVGGSSAVNGMIYFRGHRDDYDGWADAGNTGWSFEDVLPFFKKHEDFADGEDEYHGVGGELRIERVRHPNPLARRFLKAAENAGFPINHDFNGAKQDGFGLHHLTQRRGERWSSARAFLHHALKRPNLTLRTEALVLGITVEDGRAVAVRMRDASGEHQIRARREIILCAGAINTPQILLLSGIGPAEELAELGIPVVLDLPGVGKNLQDHPCSLVQVKDRSRSALALTLRGLPRLAMTPLQYLFFRSGALAESILNGGGFVRSRPGLTRPNINIAFMALARQFGQTFPRLHGVNMFVWLLQPKSRGEVRLSSASATDKPIIEPRFFTDPSDVEAMVEGIKIVRKLAATEPFASMLDGETVPGERASSDAELSDYVKRFAGTIYHPVGTCKMGPASDPMAVVDSQLRVRGIDGLRIGDVSIMPTIVSGGTNAPAMMVGERLASFLMN
ncbi:GMC family oxidoreductase N-terminal domain-containing protein [soil metagenome]